MVVAAQQVRSRATEASIFDAASSLLREGGLDACTIPAIASRAGVAVGTVYRRFADKDELLSRVVLQFLDKSADAMVDLVGQLSNQSSTLVGFVERFIEQLILGYRAEPVFTAAIHKYGREHPSELFRTRYRAAVETAHRHVAAALVLYDEVNAAHSDPFEAARFAVFTAGLTLQGILIYGAASRSGPWDDQQLQSYITAMLVSFLSTPAPTATQPC